MTETVTKPVDNDARVLTENLTKTSADMLARFGEANQNLVNYGSWINNVLVLNREKLINFNLDGADRQKDSVDSINDLKKLLDDHLLNGFDSVVKIVSPIDESVKTNEFGGWLDQQVAALMKSVSFEEAESFGDTIMAKVNFESTLWQGGRNNLVETGFGIGRNLTEDVENIDRHDVSLGQLEGEEKMRGYSGYWRNFVRLSHEIPETINDKVGTVRDGSFDQQNKLTNGVEMFAGAINDFVNSKKAGE